MAACHVASVIIHCRPLAALAVEEERALTNAIDKFKSNYAIVQAASEVNGSEDFLSAVKLLLSTWERVVQEFADAKAGHFGETPLCMVVHSVMSKGEGDDSATESGIAKALLQQAECRRLAPEQSSASRH